MAIRPMLSKTLPDDLDELEVIINHHEHEAAPLRKGAKAKIGWYGGKKQKTDYAIVYLHGFKASHPEGYPVHKTIADKFGCNLYLSRLYGHGQIRVNKFDEITPQKFIRSAEYACKIGQKIGEKVILMGCSTGGLLALYLATQPEFTSSIVGLILYSPLIHLYGIQSILLENKYGRRILRLFPGKNYPIRSADPFSSDIERIWYRSCNLNGALMLGSLVEHLVKPALFQKVQCATFIGYYYKNKYNHDRIVSTSAIKRVAKKLGATLSNLVIKNFPHANSHVICSSLLSDAVEDVTDATKRFMTDKMALNSLPGPPRL